LRARGAVRAGCAGSSGHCRAGRTGGSGRALRAGGADWATRACRTDVAHGLRGLVLHDGLRRAAPCGKQRNHR